MNIHKETSQKQTDFLDKSALAITAIAVLFVTPFSIYNFFQGHTLLGVGTLAIVSICAVNTWNCLHNRYQPLIILLGLVPCVIFLLISAFRELGLIGALWTYPAALSFYFTLPERFAWIANTLLFAFVLPEAWQIFDTPTAARYIATLLATSIFAGVFIRFITQQQIKLETLAITDSLTGLYNRTQLDKTLEKAHSQSLRASMPMSLLMIDVDHFKEINDLFGHYTGDTVLQKIASHFQKRMRGSDTIFRFGGEEFVILLYGTNASDAHTVAEEVCKEIAQLPLLPNKTVTVSIGVSELQLEDNLSNWMKRSDQNLYSAKSNGRNQVVSSQITK